MSVKNIIHKLNEEKRQINERDEPWYVKQGKTKEEQKEKQRKLINKARDILIRDYGYKPKEPEFDYHTDEYYFWINKRRLEIRKDMKFYLQDSNGIITPLNTDDPNKAVREIVKELK